MKIVQMADPVRFPRMTTAEIRDTFLLQSLDEPGKIHLRYVDLDRAVVGMAAPLRRVPSPSPHTRNCVHRTLLSAVNLEC
jgi:5-keto 4-deoxyuronate isomerase